MAEINSPGQHKNKSGVRRSKKLSTRVDLTPMVDLGFLLITFFIFNTTMSEATSMKFVLPDDTENPVLTKESATLTLLLSGNDRIYYYEGFLKNDGSNLKITNSIGIRDVIIRKKKTTNDKDLVIIIKPGKESIYKNTVDAFDEMSINDVKRYAIVDVNNEELNFMRNTALN